MRVRRRDEELRKRATEQDRGKEKVARESEQEFARARQLKEQAIEKSIRDELGQKQKVIAELAAKKAAETEDRVKQEFAEKVAVEVKEKVAQEIRRPRRKDPQAEGRWRLGFAGPGDDQRKLLDGDKKPVIKARKEPQ